MKLVPSITTTEGSDWKNKLKEVKDLKIEEVAFFPTCLSKEQRNNFYELLKQSSIKRIPFVHLRNDMDVSEIDFLVKNYGTKIFNTHSEREYSIDKEWLTNYREIICIENTPNSPFDEKEIKNYGGICLDFAHLEDARLLNLKVYENEISVLSKFPIKCNHISVIKKDFSSIEKKGKLHYHSHHMDNLSELDYLRNYPIQYFSDFCAIELDNNVSEQLETIKHINNLMVERDKFISKMLEY
jgi:hypothetical protein